jgi:CRISPR-associated protein Csm4
MQLYKTRLIPESPFATPLRGDTLFGQLCWGILFQYGEARLKELLEGYEFEPFMVVSDPFAPGFLPKPTLPPRMLGLSPLKREEESQKVWIAPEALVKGAYHEAKRDDEVGNCDQDFVQAHHHLDYRNFRMDGDRFAPYNVTNYQLSDKEIYFLVDESRLSRHELEEVLAFVGMYGYGKDSTIGKGRFRVEPLQRSELHQRGEYFMTLSASVLEGIKCQQYWYELLVHFGKHGALRAYQNPFKYPLLMAGCGAVVRMDEVVNLSYIGRGVRGISPTYPDTVHQGYAIVTAIGGIEA